MEGDINTEGQIADPEKSSQEQIDPEQSEGAGMEPQKQEGETGQEEENGTDQPHEQRISQNEETGEGQEETGPGNVGEDEKINGDKQEEIVEEEEGYAESPPPDPAAPLNLTDSQERLKPRFKLRPEQLVEVEQLWDLYQDYTPAYTDINGYITEAELVYMLKCLFLMTYTPEQLQELIGYCVKPPHPQGHISFDQFLKMVTIRQRDFPVEDELRAALQILDTGKEGMVNREYLMEVLLKQGYKMNPKQLNNLIKEVDIRNDGTIGIDDVVGTLGIDLTSDDMMKPKEEEENPND